MRQNVLSFSAAPSSYEPTRLGSAWSLAQSCASRMTPAPRCDSISSRDTVPATSASLSRPALMHSASMPMSTSARVTSTALSCTGRSPGFVCWSGIICRRGIASLSADRSISRFPAALTGTVSPSGVRALNEVPDAAAAASRGESASHAATNSTTRLLEASELDATSAEEGDDPPAPFFLPRAPGEPLPDWVASRSGASPPISASPSLTPSPDAARSLTSRSHGRARRTARAHRLDPARGEHPTPIPFPDDAATEPDNCLSIRRPPTPAKRAPERAPHDGGASAVAAAVPPSVAMVLTLGALSNDRSARRSPAPRSRGPRRFQLDGWAPTRFRSTWPSQISPKSDTGKQLDVQR